jgi:type II secretory pathway pseudopilin PulG
MTLVELLVVVSILMLLAVIAIPAVRPALEGRRVRESARAINVFIGSAQSRAMDIGRPVGVQIQRDPLLPQAGTVLYQVEVPPPYAGEVVGAAVAVQDWTYTDAARTVFYWPDGSTILKLMFRVGECAYPRVQVGDQVRLNLGGPLYTVVRDTGTPVPPDYPVDSDGFVNFSAGAAVLGPPDPPYVVDRVLTVRLPPPAVAVPYPPAPIPPFPCDTSNPAPFLANWSSPVPFQFIRQPARTAVAPLRLDSRMAIDLAYSGTDGFSFESHMVGAPPAADTTPVTIMFSPSGEVTSVWYARRELRYRDPMFLLIGRRERVPTQIDAVFASQAEDGLLNYQDLGNLWIWLNPRTGLVTTSEVAEVPAGGVPLDSRSYAREGQTIGGR